METVSVMRRKQQQTDPLARDNHPVTAGLGPDGSTALYRVDSQLATDTAYEKSTIQAAIDAAVSGDCIWIEAGEYSIEGLVFNNKAITVVAAQGTQLLPVDPDASLTGLTLHSGSHARIHNLRLSGFALGVSVQGASPTFSSLIIEDGSRAVFTDADSRPYYFNCLLRTHFGPNCGFYTNAGHVTFVNCSIVGNEVPANSYAGYTHINALTYKRSGSASSAAASSGTSLERVRWSWAMRCIPAAVN